MAFYISQAFHNKEYLGETFHESAQSLMGPSSAKEPFTMNPTVAAHLRGSVPSAMTLVRDELALLHRYQSQMLGWILITLATIAALVSCCVAKCCSPFTSLQHHYWTSHFHNERELFRQAAEQHSRLLIMQRIKRLFGFVPGSEDVKEIRIPTHQDWRDISAPSLLCVGGDSQGRYSFLGDRVAEDHEEGKSEGIELQP
ncbi:calcium homeostasis modulator protein 4 isoform X3 [Tamandua tetradactyla]|uniref:calcium homeostasis modulator protein 4 isoform X3 n=1 Tax=Tamandua tetradactyla TaxID=48850 RepID=UPI0040547C84